MTTIKRVNAELTKQGFKAELVRGDGYHYFVGDDVEYAFSTSVMVCYTSHLSVEEWVACAETIRDESRERKSLVEEIATESRTTYTH